MLWLLLACRGPGVPPCEDPTLPDGPLYARLGVWLDTDGAFETRSRADITLGEDRVTGVIRERWREPSPFYPDCTVHLSLDAQREPTGDCDSAEALYVGRFEVVEDTCGLEPYAGAFDGVITVMDEREAVPLLADAFDLPEPHVDRRRSDIAEQTGRLPQGWFLLWGPDPETLWPLGFLFADPVDP